MTDTADAYRAALESFINYTTVCTAHGLGAAPITHVHLDSNGLFIVGDGAIDGDTEIALDLRGGDATPDELRAALESELTAPDAIFEP